MYGISIHTVGKMEASLGTDSSPSKRLVMVLLRMQKGDQWGFCFFFSHSKTLPAQRIRIRELVDACFALACIPVFWMPLAVSDYVLRLTGAMFVYS